MVIILMGVSGSGKTRVGKLLSRKTGLPFYDGDDFHPPANLRKMKNERPLNDQDRLPWLKSLASNVQGWEKNGGAVLACSALKKHYRDLLTKNSTAQVQFIHLKGPQELIARRLKQREGHFMPPALLASQFKALEEPDNALAVSVDQTPEEIVRQILYHLRSVES